MGSCDDNVLEEHSVDELEDRTALYEQRRRILTSAMEYESPNCTLVILGRDGPLRPDFIYTALNQLDPSLEEIRQHWAGRSTEPRNLSCCTIALCSDADVADRVTKELQLISRSVIAVTFLEFFRALVEAEIRHPYFEGGYTRITIKGKRALPSDQKLQLENSLMDFGPCKKINFHTPSGNYGTVCTIMYEFAAHAIGAKTVLDGQEFDVTGRVSVQLQMTQKVKAILGFVKEYFV